jgi:hypothetical protein
MSDVPVSPATKELEKKDDKKKYSTNLPLPLLPDIQRPPLLL